MNHVNYFKDLFESFPKYRKIVLLLFLCQKDDDLVKERVFFKKKIIIVYVKNIKLFRWNRTKNF